MGRDNIKSIQTIKEIELNEDTIFEKEFGTKIYYDEKTRLENGCAELDEAIQYTKIIVTCFINLTQDFHKVRSVEILNKDQMTIEREKNGNQEDFIQSL